MFLEKKKKGIRRRRSGSVFSCFFGIREKKREKEMNEERAENVQAFCALVSVDGTACSTSHWLAFCGRALCPFLLSLSSFFLSFVSSSSSPFISYFLCVLPTLPYIERLADRSAERSMKFQSQDKRREGIASPCPIRDSLMRWQ